MRAVAVLCVGLLGMAGCRGLERAGSHKLSPQTYSQYHLDGYQWEAVGRVLVLPVLNESPYTNAGDQVRTALTAELQEAGRFEVVAGPPDDRAPLSKLVHRSGRFDEGVMLEIGEKTRADVIVHATVTHFSPYPRPRLGLVLQAVGPREAKVVASVDGLWDATDARLAERVRAHYRRKAHERGPFARTHIIAKDDSFADELALDSPALFQRFVAYEAVRILLDLPVPGVTAKLGEKGLD